jgi:hypothetical protein
MEILLPKVIRKYLQIVIAKIFIFNSNNVSENNFHDMTQKMYNYKSVQNYLQKNKLPSSKNNTEVTEK